MGAAVYVGEVAKATWCELCALEVFGRRVTGKLEAINVDQFSEAFPEFARAMDRLKEKAKVLRPERSWTGGDCGGRRPRACSRET
jgi:hypothetical protein